ncbi:MAG TPA: response regulator transcription factor [Steroidobacteraceae bacterium]|nr:response regulator transcription factor [Steroidobacteraceae bacterium]
MTAKRLIVIDDHPFVREGLKQLLARHPGFTIVAEAANAAEARRSVVEHGPDIAVVDLALGIDDGHELIRWLRAEHPALTILVLSMQDEALYAERLLRLGVAGYVMKNAAGEDFIVALERVARGQRHLSEAMNARLRRSAASQRQSGDHAADPVGRLTARERQVLRSIGSGRSTREIAAELGPSVKTVDAHRRSIRDKLGLQSARDVLRFAADWVASQPSD